MADNAPAAANDPARIHLWVTGRVQGVGFRAHVAYHAGKIGVNGWVRNVGYDTVETVAEGTVEQVEQFIQAVRTGSRASRVDECQMEQETPAGEFHEFKVKSSR